MKIVAAIAKILAALAAVIGAIYLLATYGEQIVAWCKKTIASLPQCPCAECNDEPAAEVEAAEEVVEAPVAEEVVEEDIEEIVVEEVPVENEVVADEADFVQE